MKVSRGDQGRKASQLDRMLNEKPEHDIKCFETCSVAYPATATAANAANTKHILANFDQSFEDKDSESSVRWCKFNTLLRSGLGNRPETVS